MTAEPTAAAPITLDLGQPPSFVRLSIATNVPLRATRWLLRLADCLAEALAVDRKAAMLELAEAYRRAADYSQATPAIRDAMLAREIRARRLAEHLS